MSKFIALYTSDTSAEEQMQVSSEADKAEMKKWMDWSVAAGPALLDFGLPLGNGKTVSSDGVKESALPVTGYSIVEATNIDAAIKLFAAHPHLSNGEIEVHEAFPIPGM